MLCFSAYINYMKTNENAMNQNYEFVFKIAYKCKS